MKLCMHAFICILMFTWRSNNVNNVNNYFDGGLQKGSGRFADSWRIFISSAFRFVSWLKRSGVMFSFFFIFSGDCSVAFITPHPSRTVPPNTTSL